MHFEKKTWMSVIIAVIMIVSVIGFALEFRAPTERLDYRGTKFVRTQQGLQSTIDGTKLYFLYFPDQLEDITFDEGAKAALDGARVAWFSYNPKDEYATEVADVLYYMEDALGAVETLFVQRGLVNNTDYALPEITCANATVSVPVLILRSGNETAITYQDGCITATAATAQEAYQAGDRLLYQLLGVMR